MDDQAHVDLADCLRKVKGAVIVSGYSSELYRDLYSDWDLRTKKTTTNANSHRDECLWLKKGNDYCKFGELPIFATTSV